MGDCSGLDFFAGRTFVPNGADDDRCRASRLGSKHAGKTTTLLLCLGQGTQVPGAWTASSDAARLALLRARPGTRVAAGRRPGSDLRTSPTHGGLCAQACASNRVAPAR